MARTDGAVLLIDEAAERALLGAVLCDPPLIGQLAPLVAPEDFGIADHARIWHVMHALFVGGRPPHLQNVWRGMEKVGIARFDNADVIYLSELVTASQFACYATHDAEIVTDLAERRRFAAAMRTSVGTAEAGGDIDTLIDETSAHLKTVIRPRTKGRYTQLANIEDEVFGPPIPRAFFGGAFWQLDRTIGGMEPGHLVMLGARTSVGKTATLLQMLWTQAEVHGAPVGVISLEMTGRQLRKRLLAQVARVDITGKERDGRTWTEDEWTQLCEARDRLNTAPFYIDQEAPRTLGSVAERIRALVLEQRCAVVGVDYLQLLSDGVRSENRAQEVARITSMLKQLAMELAVPIIALAQLNRGVDQRDSGVPTLADFKESGAIEENADVAILLHRDRAYKKKYLRLTEDAVDDNPRQFVCFAVEKNRVGAVGSVVLEYVPHLTEFVAVGADPWD